MTVALVTQVGAALSLAYMREPHAFARAYAAACLGEMSRDEHDQFIAALTDLRVARALGDAQTVSDALATIQGIMRGHEIPLVHDTEAIVG